MMTLGKQPYPADACAVPAQSGAATSEVGASSRYGELPTAPLPGSSHSYVRHPTPHRCAYCGRPSYWMCDTCQLAGLGNISVCGSKTKRDCMWKHVNGNPVKHTSAFMSAHGKARVRRANLKRRCGDCGEGDDEDSAGDCIALVYYHMNMSLSIEHHCIIRSTLYTLQPELSYSFA